MKKLLKIIILLIILAGLACAGWYLWKWHSFKKTLAAAQQGDVNAQMAVAEKLKTGAGAQTNAQEVADWYAKAAAQGDPQAAYELAQMYLEGNGVARDIESAVSYLELSADKGYAPAQYMLGEMYQTGNDVLKQDALQGFLWWLQASRQGDAQATSALSQIPAKQLAAYRYAQQIDSLLQQAQQGEADSLALAGEMFQSGIGVERNAEKAAELFMQAAQAGSARAHYHLFVLYDKGEGALPKDEEKAYLYLKRAADLGYPQAQYELGARVYKNAQTPEERKEALDLFETAGRKNNADALYMSGIIYMEGQDVPQDLDKASQMFLKAANLGNAYAQ